MPDTSWHAAPEAEPPSVWEGFRRRGAQLELSDDFGSSRTLIFKSNHRASSRGRAQRSSKGEHASIRGNAESAHVTAEEVDQELLDVSVGLIQRCTLIPPDILGQIADKNNRCFPSSCLSPSRAFRSLHTALLTDVFGAFLVPRCRANMHSVLSRNDVLPVALLRGWVQVVMLVLSLVCLTWASIAEHNFDRLGISTYQVSLPCQA